MYQYMSCLLMSECYTHALHISLFFNQQSRDCSPEFTCVCEQGCMWFTFTMAICSHKNSYAVHKHLVYLTKLYASAAVTHWIQGRWPCTDAHYIWNDYQHSSAYSWFGWKSHLLVKMCVGSTINLMNAYNNFLQPYCKVIYSYFFLQLI